MKERRERSVGTLANTKKSVLESRRREGKVENLIIMKDISPSLDEEKEKEFSCLKYKK
jgi:hypothetical protein